MGGGGSWLQAPFVFTPDLAYVMGGKDSANYRKFVELCCTCYQILRKNANMYSLDRITAAAKGPLRGLKGPLRTVRYVGGGVVASSRPYVPSALERTRVPFRFITMFSMMISSGMPELTKEEDIRYLQEAFALDMTDASAV